MDNSNKYLFIFNYVLMSIYSYVLVCVAVHGDQRHQVPGEGVTSSYEPLNVNAGN